MKKFTGKEWYFSRTILLAVAQGIIGVVAAIEATKPEWKGVGALAIVKSLVDIYIRFNTSQAIK